MTEIETFEDYLREARDEFVMEINSNEWNTKVRTAAENFLICFDQLRERFLASNTVAPVDNIVESEEKKIEFGEWQLCPKCGGSGQIEGLDGYGTGSTYSVKPCDVCGGSKILTKPIIEQTK